MSMMSMTEDEMKQHELKYKAKCAADTILEAEKHKNDKELAPHLKAEMKERAKHLDSAMGKKKAKAAPKKAAPAPAKKSAPKKRK